MAFATIIKVFNKLLSYRKKKKVLSVVSLSAFTVFVLILFIFDLIMTLSERRNVVSFLNF